MPRRGEHAPRNPAGHLDAVQSRVEIVTFEDWGFKRMSVFGFARSKAILFLADVLDTLSTLARLVREATFASQSVAT